MWNADRPTGNVLLSCMTAADRALLAPLLHRIDLERGDLLVAAHRPTTYCHFLEGGIASLLSGSREDERHEMAVIGREGFTGLAMLLRAGQSPNDVVLQVDGASALRIAAADLNDAVMRSGTLATLLLRYVHTVIVQIASNSLAGISDRLEARLARWLLMCHDRESGDTIALTHELIAVMIGVHRSAVTHALHALEGTGLIRAQRGLIGIVDRAGLEGVAGAAYGVPEEEYRRLIGPFGRSPGVGARAHTMAG